MAASRMLLFWLIALVLMASLASWLPAGAHADALRRIERETSRDRDDDDDDGYRSSRSSSSGWTRDDDDDGDGEWFLKVLGFPWSIPRASLETSTLPEVGAANRCLGSFALRPYANGPGILRSACDEETSDEKRAAFALASESGFLLQGVVPASLTARLLLPKRMELSGRIDWLYDVLSRSRDQGWMNSAHLVVRFAQSKRVDFRTGLGPRYFKLDETRWGIDLLYGVDVYGKRPIVLRVELHAGILGDAGLGQARATLGCFVGKAELYAGYDHTYLADSKGLGVPLGGPIAGVRAWF